MATTIPSAAARRRKNNARVNRPQPATPIFITGATGDGGGSALTVTFDQPVTLAGTPQIRMTGNAATPVSAAQTGPTTVVVTYSAAIGIVAGLTIAVNDPAVRNASGGFVAATNVSLT